MVLWLLNGVFFVVAAWCCDCCCMVYFSFHTADSVGVCCKKDVAEKMLPNKCCRRNVAREVVEHLGEKAGGGVVGEVLLEGGPAEGGCLVLCGR